MLQRERALRSTEPQWLFCYGTLCNNSIYERLTEAPALASLPATLQGWNRFDVPGAAFPGAVPSRFSGAVQGELRPIETAAIWDILDTYEGSQYLRVPCVVQTAQGFIDAQIYQYDLERCHRIEHLVDNAGSHRAVTEWISRHDHPSHALSSAPNPGSMPGEDDSSREIADVFVLVINEIPIGWARLVTHGILEHNEVKRITGVYVIPELRHLGLGKLLVEALVNQARQSGMHELYAHTEARQQFFEHLGWRERSVVQIGDTEVNLMRRSI